MSETNNSFTKPDSGNRSGRVRRPAVGGKKDVLSVHGNRDPNYEYRMVNKKGNRLEEMTEHGYEVVQDKDVYIAGQNATTGTSHEAVVNKDGDRAILMRQPKKFHEEDRIARAKMIAEGEEDMLRNVNDTSEGRYGTMSNTRDGT